MIEYQRKTYGELRSEATAFLDRYHKAGSVPIPIEEIVEFQLELDIVPIPGLRDRCQSEADGFLARGRDAIFVDQFIAEGRENRYRFTLAYEVGRYLLQESIVGTCDIDSLDSYLDWHAELPDRVWKDAKFECYDFAGLILVPTPHLTKVTRREIDRANAGFRAAGRDPDEHINPIWNRVAAHMADNVFCVSAGVIKRRLQKENLLPNSVSL